MNKPDKQKCQHIVEFSKPKVGIARVMGMRPCRNPARSKRCGVWLCALHESEYPDHEVSAPVLASPERGKYDMDPAWMAARAHQEDGCEVSAGSLSHASGQTPNEKVSYPEGESASRRG